MGGFSYYFVKHEKHQATYLYQMDLTRSFQEYKYSHGYSEYLEQTETISLKKSNHDCFEDNSMNFRNCINNFISDQIGCKLPWAKEKLSKEDLDETCETEEDLKAFRNLSIHMTTKEVHEKVAKKGCFKPNCKRTIWVKNQHDLEYPWFEQTLIFINIPSTAKVIQRTEILLANFSTFVADCGSYLGLFLGASVLSLSDMLISCFKRVLLDSLKRIGTKTQNIS